MTKRVLNHKPSPPPVRVQDDGGLHKYFAMVPHTVVRGQRSLGLSLPARWLYVYLKSVSGESGRCARSTTTIAKESGLGRGTVSTAKQELQAVGLIRLASKTSGYHATDTITIVDIWAENIQEFGPQGCSSGEQRCSGGEQPGIPVITMPYAEVVQEPNAVVQEMNQRRKRSQEQDPEQIQGPPLSPQGEKPVYSQGFLAFWQAYPVKKGQAQAWKQWKRQHLEPQTARICASIADHQTHDRAWRRGYIKYPATFLAHGCWQDEFETVPSTNPYDLSAWVAEEGRP